MVVFIGFDKCWEKGPYSTFSENLMEFQFAVGLLLSLSLSLSLSLRKIIEDLKNSKDLMAEFIFKKATFDKSCMSLCDKQKLNRKLQTNQDQVDQTPERFFRKTSDFSTDSYKCFFFHDASK